MSVIQQLVYASRATFQSTENVGGVELEVGRILVQSRRNNPRRGLVGALYYGDGCFFQCLEGPQEELDKLYGQLLQDPRHTDVTVLRRHSIDSTSFSVWSMKYVPASNDVLRLLGERGKERFDPYSFDDALIDAMVTLLHHRNDEAPNPSKGSPVETAPEPPAQPASHRRMLAWVVLLGGVVAAGVYFALLR
ncbi:MAG: BLUF domain-containing protein [Stenotrophomonas sp.]